MLAIDPGMTTGVAVLNSQGEVILATELYGDTDLVVRTLASVQSDDQVIEQGPPNRNNAYLDDLDGRLRQQYPDATWMRPSDWKSTPRAESPVADSSIHVRDAVRMGREHLHRRGYRLVT